MAKAKTTTAPKPKKKTSKTTKAVALKAAPKTAKKPKKKSGRASQGAEVLWKLAEHPLVGELLAIGATAAVAAIAEGVDSKGKKNVSSKSVKAAGKAAAAAIGTRLISEFADAKKGTKPSKA